MDHFGPVPAIARDRRHPTFDEDYIYAGTYAYTLISKLLSEPEREKIIGTSSVTELTEAIRSTFFGTYLAGGNDIEQATIRAMADAKKMLERLSPNSHLLSMLWLRYDFYNLKILIKHSRPEYGGPSEDSFVPLGLHQYATLERAVKTGSGAALQNSLAGALSSIPKNPDELDTFLEARYLAAALNEAEESDKPFAVRYARLLINLFTILSALRAHARGHTPTHMSYLAMRDDEVIGLFTGGSMLYAAVGRTDLISEALTHSLSLQQHASVRHLAGLVDDGIPVFPTHGFGSHCSSGTGDIIHSGTVADERTRNPALLTADPEAFADELIAGLGPYPTYYARMDPANRQGPGRVPTELPEPITAGDVAAHLDKGSMVVDLRARGPFAAGHLPGSVNVELRDDLPTYLGWVHDPTAPLLLLAPDERDLREAQVMLARIGLDDIVGVGIGPVTDFAGPGGLGVTRRVRWPEVNDARPADAVVLDTRDQHEWDSGHHSAAIHIPFHEVLAREGELPAGPVWVYCATGNRAAVAASLLARVGREVVLIDDFCLPGDVPG